MKAQAVDRQVRRKMVEPVNTSLSIGKQCRLLSISRSWFYHTPKGEPAMNLMLMRQIDEQFLETPFFGVRQVTWHLRNEGHVVNEKRIRRLMRLMGLMPIYQKPNTSKAAKGHKTYPYLLRGLRVNRPNQVWGETISAIGPRTMVERHHLSAHATRVPLAIVLGPMADKGSPGGDYGLAHPQGAGMAHLQYAGG